MQVNCTASNDHKAGKGTKSETVCGAETASAMVTNGAKRQVLSKITSPAKLATLQFINANAFFVHPLQSSEKFVYILTEYRNAGIGQILFDAYIDEAKKRNCTMLKWQVLDWNEPAIRFYKKNQVEFLEDWLTCRKLI